MWTCLGLSHYGVGRIYVICLNNSPLQNLAGSNPVELPTHIPYQLTQVSSISSNTENCKPTHPAKKQKQKVTKEICKKKKQTNTDYI